LQLLGVVMPANVLPAVIGIAVLAIIASVLDWFIARPALLVLIVAAISGGGVLWVRHKRARNRV
jgi:hypothetical protein